MSSLFVPFMKKYRTSREKVSYLSHTKNPKFLHFQTAVIKKVIKKIIKYVIKQSIKGKRTYGAEKVGATPQSNGLIQFRLTLQYTTKSGIVPENVMKYRIFVVKYNFGGSTH